MQYLYKYNESWSNDFSEMESDLIDILQEYFDEYSIKRQIQGEVVYKPGLYYRLYPFRGYVYIVFHYNVSRPTYLHVGNKANEFFKNVFKNFIKCAEDIKNKINQFGYSSTYSDLPDLNQLVIYVKM